MLDFEQLKALVAHATNPTGGQFYRNFYKLHDASALNISSLGEWRALPPITKDDLIAVPLRERSFLPLSVLDHLRTSSGTSGKPPLFSPRTVVLGMDYRLQYHDFKNAILAFPVPMMPHWHEAFQRSNSRSGRVVVFDPKRPGASIRLARAAGVDAMSLCVFHVQAAGEHMKREGINKRIRLIEIAAEICSHLLYKYMRATFPNAVILQSYASGEVEDVHIGMPCKPMDGSEPLGVYHVKKTHYLEIINTETGEIIEPRAGAEGDLLITAYPGEPSAFPLLRFRIGDTVRVVKDSCPHGSWSFTVLGRTDMDFVKIPGGMLRADELGRVLRMFPERISDLFELHCYMKETQSGPLIELILKVETLGNVNLETLARDIGDNLRTGPSFTYTEGIKDGRYLPIRCELLEQMDENKKHKRIVLH